MTKKNIAKDLLREMALMKEQRARDGHVDLSRVRQNPYREPIARSLMNDAGLDYDNKEHVVTMLNLVAMHLHGEFPKGAPRRFVVDDFELLHAASLNANDNHARKTDLLKSLRGQDPRLASVDLPALKQQFDRVLSKAIAGELRVETHQQALLSKIVSDLCRFAVRPRAKPARRVSR